MSTLPTRPDILHRVADLIERHADEYSQATFFGDSLVDSAEYIAGHRHTCGTPRCAAGWILTVATKREVNRAISALARETYDEDREYFDAHASFGVSGYQDAKQEVSNDTARVAAEVVGAGRLLINAMESSDSWGNDAHRCAQALRHYADTGALTRCGRRGE